MQPVLPLPVVEVVAVIERAGLDDDPLRALRANLDGLSPGFWTPTTPNVGLLRTCAMVLGADADLPPARRPQE